MAVLNSAMLAAGATLIALPLGTLLAVLLGRFDLAGRRLAGACLFALLLLPLYVQLSGWDAALGKLGWYSLRSGAISEPVLAGLRGAIFVHGMAATPWFAAIVGLGLLSVRRAEEEAALLVYSPSRVIWSVTLPQIAPYLIAAALWTVVMTTSDMTVTNIYLIDPGEQTYTERFYMSAALSADAGKAAASALPGLLGLGILTLGALWLTIRLAVRPATLAVADPILFSSGRWRAPATAGLWLMVFVLLGIPLVSLVFKAGFVVIRNGDSRVPAWSLLSFFRQSLSAPARFGEEFLGTAVVAGGAASLALLSGAALAWKARRRRAWSLVAALLVAIGLTAPGPLVGVGLIQLLNHDLPPALRLADGTTKSWLLLLYDETPLAPILAQAIRALPLAILVLWHSFSTLDPDVLAAAALDGLNPRQVFQRIALPQRWRQLVAAWLIGFAVAAGDLAWAHLVTPPGLDLLSRRVFGLVHAGVEEQVAAVCLVIVAVYGALSVGVLWLLHSQSEAAS